MTVLSYAHHQNVNGQLDTLDKIRSFAVSLGWVQEYWQSGYIWDVAGGGGLVASANHGILTLSGTGYGTQSPIFTLNTYTTYNDGYNSLCVGGRSQVALDEGSAVQPWAQDVLTANPSTFDHSAVSRIMAMHIGTATYDDLWLFGDAHWICAALSMDGIFVQFLHFGSFHMFDSAPAQGYCVGFTALSDEDSQWSWDRWNATDVETKHPFWPNYEYEYIGYSRRLGVFDIYYDSRAQQNGNSNYMRSNLYPYDTSSSHPDYIKMNSNTPLMNIGTCLKANAYSNKRPLLRQVYFCQRQADSLWIPVCKSPCYFLNPAGLSIGETLTYGTEQFVCFPCGPYYSEVGVAFQIA